MTRLLLIVLLVAQPALAQLRPAQPETLSVSSVALARMDTVIQDEIAKQRLPGAVVLVGRRGRLVWQKSYGSRLLS
jgi:CubicO group peptidase (beta-lactamase class C family)